MKEQKNTDLSFIKETAANAAALTLPDGLRREKIEALVTGKEQKKNRRPLRAAISVAVAACIVLTSVFAFRSFVSAPSVVRLNEQSAGTAVDYKGVGKLIRAHRRAENRFNYAFGRKFAADSAIEEEFDINGSYSDSAVPTAAASSGNGVATGADPTHAETNVRTEGVLESDVVKTDGRFLYLLSGEGSELLIVDPMGEQREIGRIELSEGQHYQNATDFYLLQNRLVVMGSFYDRDANKNRSTVRVYDITDPAAPVRTRSLFFDGYTVSSRVAGEKLLLVTNYSPAYDDFKASDYTTFVPSYSEEGTTACYTAEGNLYLGASDKDSFLTVTLLDLSQPDSAPQNVSVFGAAGDIYCSGETLYVYDAVYSSDVGFFGRRDFSADGVKTSIQKYDVSGAIAVCTATGTVEGTILNTFALDEADGYLRVAAGDWTENRVYVLDETLKQVGASEVLAKNESIRSVRFMGNYAYVVTFRQTDPLFVLDLSDPTAPVITGEVKLPGFSSYLHPAGEDLLLGLGFGGTETGLDGSMKLSLFDVSDPTAPKELDSISYQNKELNLDYKAFVTLPDGTFLIPYVTYEERWVPYDENGVPVTDVPETLPPATEPAAAPAAETEPAVEPTAEAEEPATAAEPETEEAAIPTEEPATAAEEAATFAPYDGGYSYTNRAGVLHVAVENGGLRLLNDFSGRDSEDWPEARASFIGSVAFLIDRAYDNIVVERFSLSTGASESSATYETAHGEYDEEPVVVYN